MIKNKLSIMDKLGVYAVFLSYTSAFPFLFFAFPYHPYKIGIAIAFLLVLSLLFFSKKVIIDSNAMIVIVSFWVGWIFLSIHFEVKSLVLMLQLIVSSIFILFISMSEDRSMFLIKIITNFGVFISFLAIVSLVFVLLGLVDLMPVFKRPGDENQMIYMFFLSLSNSVYLINGEQFPRVASFFDEPGQFALFLTYMIIIESLTNKPVWRRYVLLLAGLSTLSLAFMFILPLLLILFRLWKFLSPLIVLSVFLAIFILIDFKDDGNMGTFVYERTLGRATYDDSRGFVGNNRYESMKAGLDVFYDNPLFGIGSENYLGPKTSIMGAVAQYGLIGIIPLYMPFLIVLVYAISKINWLIIIAMATLFITYIQRPLSISFYSMTMVYFVFFVSLKYRKNNNSQILTRQKIDS